MIPQVEKMRSIGAIVANTLNQIESFIQPGVTTKDIDLECNRILQQQGAQSSALGYHGFPGYVCVSVNTEVCHGVPGSRIIQNGDMISVDVVANKDGHHGDSCYTFLLNCSNKRRNFLANQTYECMWSAIEIIRPGIRVGDLGHAMQSYAEKHNLSIVEDFCGHGIGTDMHQSPQIPFYGKANTGKVLTEGMCLTVEPMLIDGNSNKLTIRNDGWTAVSAMQFLSAQFEHTILITPTGYEVLTFNRYDTARGKNKIGITIR